MTEFRSAEHLQHLINCVISTHEGDFVCLSVCSSPMASHNGDLSYSDVLTNGEKLPLAAVSGAGTESHVRPAENVPAPAVGGASGVVASRKETVPALVADAGTGLHASISGNLTNPAIEEGVQVEAAGFDNDPNNVYVTPLAPGARRKLSSERSQSPSPPRQPPTGSVSVTPLSPKQKTSRLSGQGTAENEEDGENSGSEDESRREVVFKTAEGGEYSVLAASTGVAIVPDEVLALKLMGEGWIGRMTVKKENGLREESPMLLDDGGMLWELRPGHYLARGVQSMRGAKKSLGNSEGRSQKSGGSSRACSFAGSAYQPKRTVSVSRGGFLEQWEPRREKDKKDKSGLGESDAYRKRSLGEEEVSSVGGSFKKPREKVQGDKANDVDEVMKVRDCEIAQSVLQGQMRKSSKLRRLVERFDVENEDLQIVAHVPYPLNGDTIFVKNLDLSLMERGEDKSCHWKSGVNTNYRLQHGETVKLYKCCGGFECDNKDCQYLLEMKSTNTKVFRKLDDAGQKACCFCNEKANHCTPTCEAEQYVVKGKKNMLVVHVGKHSHDLQASQPGHLLEKYKVVAILSGSESKQVSLYCIECNFVVNFSNRRGLEF